MQSRAGRNATNEGVCDMSAVSEKTLKRPDFKNDTDIHKKDKTKTRGTKKYYGPKEIYSRNKCWAAISPFNSVR